MMQTLLLTDIEIKKLACILHDMDPSDSRMWQELGDADRVYYVEYAKMVLEDFNSPNWTYAKEK